MKKNVLVTGANGYIGKHVVKQLKARDVFVTSLGRTLSEESPADVQIAGDVFDESLDLSSYCDSMPDCCIHLAWRNGFIHDCPSHIEDLPRHYSFLKRVINAGVPQVVVMGSMHEVGYWEGAIDQDTPCNPQSLYGIAKNALREALFVELSKKDVVLQWLRGYYIYGDDAQSQSIFGKLLRAAESGEKSFPFTSGNNQYDFISVSELAQMISCVALQEKVTGVINCCSGEPISLANAVERFIRDNKLDITLDYGAFPDRPYDSPGVWGDATIIKSLINE